MKFEKQPREDLQETSDSSLRCAWHGMHPRPPSALSTKRPGGCRCRCRETGVGTRGKAGVAGEALPLFARQPCQASRTRRAGASHRCLAHLALHRCRETTSTTTGLVPSWFLAPFFSRFICYSIRSKL